MYIISLIVAFQLNVFIFFYLIRHYLRPTFTNKNDLFCILIFMIRRT